MFFVLLTHGLPTSPVLQKVLKYQQHRTLSHAVVDLIVDHTSVSVNVRFEYRCSLQPRRWVRPWFPFTQRSAEDNQAARNLFLAATVLRCNKHHQHVSHKGFVAYRLHSIKTNIFSRCPYTVIAFVSPISIILSRKLGNRSLHFYEKMDSNRIKL